MLLQNVLYSVCLVLSYAYEGLGDWWWADNSIVSPWRLTVWMFTLDPDPSCVVCIKFVLLCSEGSSSTDSFVCQRPDSTTTK